MGNKQINKQKKLTSFFQDSLNVVFECFFHLKSFSTLYLIAVVHSRLLIVINKLLKWYLKDFYLAWFCLIFDLWHFCEFSDLFTLNTIKLEKNSFCCGLHGSIPVICFRHIVLELVENETCWQGTFQTHWVHLSFSQKKFEVSDKYPACVFVLIQLNRKTGNHLHIHFRIE